VNWRNKKLTFAATLGGAELRLVAAIVRSSAWPPRFVLEIEASWRLRLTNRVSRNDWSDPTMKWAGPNLTSIIVVNRRQADVNSEKPVRDPGAFLAGPALE
jgi:hypothetical protein